MTKGRPAPDASTGPHPLVIKLREARHASSVIAGARALVLPLQAVRFLVGHRCLWPFVVVPALINLVLFVGSVGLVLAHADWVASALWTRPEVGGVLGALILGLWYALYAGVVVFGLVVAYVATVLIGGIVASPFNDALAERVEIRLAPGSKRPDSGRSWWGEFIHSVVSTATIALLYGVLLVPILLLNVIPVAGSMAATVLGTGLGAFFLALEYTDVTLSRYGMPLRQKLRLLREHWVLAGGFGLSTSFLLWIPLLNVLCIPIAVVGGTALALALVRRE